jgi:CrcB protein
MTGIQSFRMDACAAKPLPCERRWPADVRSIAVSARDLHRRAAGALARTGAVIAFGDPAHAWPWSIFVINLTGAFALGHVAARPPLRLRTGIYAAALVGTGFCGAFTTFSTMMLELLQMLDAGRLGLAALYAATSIAGGLAAIALATRLARSLAARA